MTEIFENHLIEGVVPPTRYGYWITAEGSVIPVGYCEHDEIAKENGFRSGYAATQAGWIRVVAQPYRGSFNVEISGGGVASRAAMALRRVISAGDYWEFHLDYGEGGGSKSFNKSGGLINLVQQSIKRMS